MIGWVIALFIPAFIILLVISLQNNRIKAQKACVAFKNYLSKNEKPFKSTIAEIIETKTYDYKNEIINSNANLFFISKHNSKVVLYSINERKQHLYSELSYKNLFAKFHNNNVIYTYSVDSFSLYHKCSYPYEDYIMRIDYPQNLFTIFK